MKKLKAAEKKIKGTLGKIWKALVAYRLFLIGIAALAVAVCLHWLVFDDWWAIVFAVPQSVLFFVFTQRDKQLSLLDYIAWTLIVVAVLAVATPLFGSGLGWHLLGNFLGFLLLLAIFGFSGYWDELLSEGFILLFFIIMVVVFFAQLVAVCINATKEEKQMNIYYDSMIDNAPYYKVEKVTSFVEKGNTYYVVVTEKDTLQLPVYRYPNAMFIDTCDYVAVVKDGSKIVRLAIK